MREKEIEKKDREKREVPVMVTCGSGLAVPGDGEACDKGTGDGENPMPESSR